MAGLGPRKLGMFEFGDSSQFHDAVIAAFPKLGEGGAYELLRTKQNSNRELCVIPPPLGGYNAEYLKSIVSQARVYIRPIQKDLSTAPLTDDSDTWVCTVGLDYCSSPGDIVSQLCTCEDCQ